MTLTIEQISALLRGMRCSARGELALHDAIADALRHQGIAFEREVRLTAHDRIDFLCEDLGIEVKVEGAITSITRQLHRYAQSDRIGRLMLVTTRMRHLSCARELNGKKVDVLHLIGGSL